MDWQARDRMRREGIETAKVGDKFYIYHSSHGGGYWGNVVKVERLTPTQIVLEGGTKISKKTCAEVGEGLYSYKTFYPALPEFRAERNRDIHERNVARRFTKLVDKLNELRKKLPVAQQEALISAIEGVIGAEESTSVSDTEED